jgi:hypothetical protein
MVDVLHFPAAPRLKISEQAWIDIAHLEMAARKLPAMEADLREPRRVERTGYARQIREAFKLHDELWQRIASITRADKLVKGTGQNELSVSRGYLVHRVGFRFIGNAIEITGFDFLADSFAPNDFRLYPLLSNLSLVVNCPYQAQNS